MIESLQGRWRFELQVSELKSGNSVLSVTLQDVVGLLWDGPLFEPEVSDLRGGHAGLEAWLKDVTEEFGK